MKKIFSKTAAKLSCLFALVIMLVSIVVPTTPVASAAILFQDDTFHDIQSDAIRIGSNDGGTVNTAIQFGNDPTASENGNILWNISTNAFGIDHTVNVTGGLSATGQVNFSGASGTRLRESANPTTSAACTTANELIVNTTLNRIEVCTVTGGAGSATWITAPAGDASTLGGLTAAQFLRSDTSDNFTSGTLTTDAGTTLDVNGVFDASGATRFAIRSGAATPGTCTEGDVFYNSTTNILLICTATDTFTTAGPSDFEAVYAADTDDTLTTGGGSFTFATGGGNVNNTLGAGEFDITSSGLIDFNSATFDVDTTGAVTIDANGASNLTTTAGILTLSTVTSGAVNVTAADNVNLTSGAGDDVTVVSGDDITFDDAQLTAAIQLTNTATGFAATLTSGGIIDNLNSFTLTTAGEGASNIGINDAGSFFTGTDAEAALQELGAVTGPNAPNNGVLTFYPEYPDAVIFSDGTNNLGTLISGYDDTDDEHFYDWTTLNILAAQDIDLRFRFPLPADFVDVNDFTYRFRTGTATEADNDVEITVFNATNETGGNPTSCGADTTNVSTAWATGTITEATLETGCTAATALNAGDIIEVLVKLIDTDGAGDFARAGFLALGYDN